MQKKTFWARRLHSLSGVAPIGIFLVEHLFTNSFSTQGADAYNEAVITLQSLPYVHWMEVFFIYLPILFHAIYGTYIAWQPRYNAIQYPMLRNRMFLLQRVTGVFLFVYIGMHVYETRFQLFFHEELEHHFFEHMQQLLSQPLTWGLYLAGVLSAAFHFANGLWTFGIVWGITAGRQAQRLSSYACAAIGFAVAGMGVNSLMGFIR